MWHTTDRIQQTQFLRIRPRQSQEEDPSEPQRGKGSQGPSLEERRRADLFIHYSYTYHILD